MSGVTNIPTPPNLGERLVAIVGRLRKYLATEGRRLRIDPSITNPIWNRLGHLAQRFCALIAHPPKSRPHTALRSKPSQPPATPPRSNFPRQRGWLRQLVPSHWINASIWEIKDLIASPELIALVATNPHLKPILRSYCFMFAIPVPAHLKAPPRKPRTPKPRAAKPPKPPKPIPFNRLTHADLFKPHPLPFEDHPPNHPDFFKRR